MSMEPDSQERPPQMSDEQMNDKQDTQERPSPNVGCYVYGVVDADTDLAPGLMGLDDVHEVFLVHGEAIAAVASLVSLDEFGEEALEEHLDDLSWLEHRARGHEQILARVREQTTLVPMRLCTIYRNESSVREMLARERTFLADALHRLEGRTEWGVKMYAVSDPGETFADPREKLAEDATNDASEQAPGPGASYLMEKRLQGRRREHADALMEEQCELAHSELAQAAVDTKLNPVQPRELTGRDEPMVFSGVYLVDDAAFESFASIVHALEADLAEDGLELELTGPWTPYNFVGSATEVSG